MQRSFTLAAAMVASLAAASAAQAASVSIGVFSFGSIANSDRDIAAALTAQNTFHGDAFVVATEDFENLDRPRAAGPSLDTAVGTFSSIDPVGGGSTTITPSEQLQLRSDGAGGRYNTTTGGQFYLDSNDNSGILWEIPGNVVVGSFDKLSFLTSDVDDVNEVTFFLTANGGVVDIASFVLGAEFGTDKRPNGELLLFTLAFSERVSNVRLALNIDPGDGFAIDSIRLTAVPLPAAAWLLIAGVGALAGVGRLSRRRAAAA